MNAGDREILADFERCRAKTLDVLKVVPPRLLSRTPRGEEATVSELFHHISAVVDGWMLRCMNDGGPMPPEYRQQSKPALAKILRASQRRLMKFFQAGGGRGRPMGRTFQRERDGKRYRFVGRNRVCYLTQHEVHHRGKIILALRQWGVKKIPFMPFDNKPVTKR